MAFDENAYGKVGSCSCDETYKPYSSLHLFDWIYVG